MQILAPPLPDFELLETILWTPAGGYFLLEPHLDRLAASADYFSIPLSVEFVQARLRQVHQEMPTVPHRVRVRLDRNGDCVVEKQILDGLPPPRRLGIAALPVNSQNVLLYHKTTQREIYEQALRRARGCDDVLLWNEKGELTESTVANLVVGKDGRLVTPPLACGLLPGVYRGKLLKERRIHEEVIRIENLAECTTLYLINSVRGMWEVTLARGQGSLPPPGQATDAKLGARSNCPTAEAKIR